MSQVKTAKTTYPVSEIIKNRWSPRSFSEQPISEEQLLTIIEGASWAMSANNEQPWRFITTLKNSQTFTDILNCLNPMNQLWAKNGAAFVVSLAKTTFDKEGNPPNHYAEHDTGLANATLIMQASTMGIYSHVMAGFNHQQLSETFNLDASLKPLTRIVLGYLGDADALEEPFKTRELTPRTRKDLSEIILNKN